VQVIDEKKEIKFHQKSHFWQYRHDWWRDANIYNLYDGDYSQEKYIIWNGNLICENYKDGGGANKHSQNF
jgi:hypothetical protein